MPAGGISFIIGGKKLLCPVHSPIVAPNMVTATAASVRRSLIRRLLHNKVHVRPFSGTAQRLLKHNENRTKPYVGLMNWDT
jgi:hypothetical protein